ncbi:MAG: efflux RND transporter periplasmic adaptor subunit [Pseudomonadota bacterium]
MRRFLLPLAAIGLLTSFPHGVPAQDAAVRPVHLMGVSPETQGVTRQFFGHVVARQTVDLAFQVSGQIVEFPAAEGETVTEGALIAELDLEPFELQRQQARLRFDQAERTFARLNRLTSSVSDVARQDAETELGLARVALRNAEFSLENATLLSPFDGLVASRNVANFSTVTQGSPVARIHDMSELRIEIDVPEVLFQRAGQDAEVSLMARFPISDEMHRLDVREFNAEASSVGQTFRLTLGLPRPEGLAVLPGSSVTVFATLQTGDPEIVIPPTAVRIGNDGATSVMRFIPAGADLGTLEEVTVELEANRDGDLVARSGLAPGDEIVRTGAHAVETGQTVRRFQGYPN